MLDLRTHRGIAQTYLNRHLRCAMLLQCALKSTTGQCKWVSSRHLRGVRVSLGTKRRSKDACARKVFMDFLSPIYFSSQLVLKRFNIDHFSRFLGSSLTRRIVYFSGRNSAANIFAQCHDVSLGLL